MSMSLKASFVSHLASRYPELNTTVLNGLVSEQLISPFQVTLSPEQINTLKQQIREYWQLREWGQQNSQLYKNLNLRVPQNYSVCMSYDFHINAEGQPELIEINTNAAFLALGLELYDFFKIPNVAGSFNFQALAQMFEDEISLCGKTEKSVAIIDENPTEQRLYLEFLIYQALLQKAGFNCGIHDINETEKLQNYSLIYNRYTDFYLQNEKSQKLKELFNENKINLSPNPYEYFLLADKQRLIDWGLSQNQQKPSSLLKTYDLAHCDRDEMWAMRKNLFFKPKNSFGSKQAYRGASMSRKAFDSVSGEGFIAQQLSVPSEIEVDHNNEKQKLKYDLRCYAYQDELQLIIARLYQGQTTNLQTRGGGFAGVRT